MSNANYFLLSGVVLAFAALLHATRIIYGWDLTLGPYNIPMWLSTIAVLVTGILAYFGLKASRD